MKTTSQRRAAFAALVLAPVLTACGFNVQTDQVYQPADGVLNRDGDVYILNALIVSGADGSGTFVAQFANNNLEQPDQLVSVTGAEITVDAEEIDIPAGGSVNLAEEGTISVEGDEVTAGGFVDLTLVFANGQSTDLKVPVVLNDGYYTDVPVPDEGEASPGDETSEEPDATEESEGH